MDDDEGISIEFGDTPPRSLETSPIDANKEPAIALLKKIFPESAPSELRQLHVERCQNIQTPADDTEILSPPRIHRSVDGKTEESKSPPAKPRQILTEDFLRLPRDIAVRRLVNGVGRYELVKDLEHRAVSQHEQRYRSTCCGYFTKVVSRDRDGGLGMTIAYENGVVRVHWLAGMEVSREPKTPPSTEREYGALQAGIYCGDVLIGIDGVAFAESVAPHESLAKHAATRLRHGPDPAVLHVQRFDQTIQQAQPSTVPISSPIHTPSLLDTSDFTGDSSPMGECSVRSDISSPTHTHRMDSRLEKAVLSPHPFIEILAAKGLVQNDDELKLESKVVHEAAACNLNHNLDSSERALSVRIVNMFEEGNETAYTLWVYDVKSGREWYAPFRYLCDFQDLRTATMALCPSVRKIPFPKPSLALNLFRSPSRETSIQKETKSRVLEGFVRSLNALTYTLKNQKGLEIAIHVQSFVGGDEKFLDAPAALPTIIQVTKDPSNADQDKVKLCLQRCIQHFTYRLFHLRSLRTVVDTFVDSFRTSAPRLQDIEGLEAQGAEALKSSAMEDLTRIHQFLDKVQDMIIDGCHVDFQRMAEYHRYDDINNNDWDRLVREAVREQVEIEIYVPLRSCVSRWLVHGWKHDDMEIMFKMRELRKKPPSFFRIPHGDGLYDWSSASNILSKGVGLSTLPTVKLRAIVAAAREIFRIYTEASKASPQSKSQNLGADDFLPIFIYCVVHAELERPRALSVLLRTLCDQINKIGEIGYYMLTFEAAITHCHEIDLTEEREQMDSFMSVPLNDSACG